MSATRGASPAPATSTGETHPCNKCGAEHPVESYRIVSGGYRNWMCRSCSNAAHRDAWRRRGGSAGLPDDVRQGRTDWVRRWREQNPEEARRLDRSFRERHREDRRQQQADQRIAVRAVEAARQGVVTEGGHDFLVAIRPIPYHAGREAIVAYPVPIGAGTPGGTILLRVQRVGDRWGVSPSPTLDPRWRRAARYACRKVDREGLA